MIKPLTLTELKKELKIMNESELIELILDLYKSNNVKEILSSKFIGDTYLVDVLDTYRKKMFDQFYTKGNRTPSLKNAKSLIVDFKKFGDLVSILDLMLYYVELGTRYTDEYGTMNQVFYESLCSIYGDFTDLLSNEGTEDLYIKFRFRVEKLVTKTCDIGWGFGEFIVEKTNDISWDYLGEDDLDE